MIKQLIGKAVFAALGAGVLIGSALPAAANPPPTLKYLIKHEKTRINQGLQSGQITYGEFVRDENRWRAIRAARRQDLQSGGLTAAERLQLRKQLDNNSNHIYFTKHNASDQPGV